MVIDAPTLVFRAHAERETALMERYAIVSFSLSRPSLWHSNEMAVRAARASRDPRKVAPSPRLCPKSRRLAPH